MISFVNDYFTLIHLSSPDSQANEHIHHTESLFDFPDAEHRIAIILESDNLNNGTTRQKHFTTY